jgi:hypothetical protein
MVIRITHLLDGQLHGIYNGLGLQPALLPGEGKAVTRFQTVTEMLQLPHQAMQHGEEKTDK